MGDSDMTGHKGSAAQADLDSVLIQASDTQLVDFTRSGSVEAFEELWHRHSALGLVAAKADAGDLGEQVNERAWSRILSEIQAGVDPSGPFRPYLYATLREEATGISSPEYAPRSKMSEAFASLPARWQDVLWYRDVEQMNPEEAGVITGLTPTTIATIQPRARRGLTSAWAQINAETAETGECRWVRERSRAFAKKTLPEGDMAAIESHVVGCPDCRTVLATARSMGTQAPKILLATVAGAASSTALAQYMSIHGPILINNDHLPASVIAGFASRTSFTPAQPVIPSPGVGSRVGTTAAASTGTAVGAGVAAGTVVVSTADTSEAASSLAEEVPVAAIAKYQPVVALMDEDEEETRRRGFLWWLFPLLVALALIAGIVWLAVTHPWDGDLGFTPSPTPSATATEIESEDPTPIETPTPTEEPTVSETPSASPEPAPEPPPATTPPPPRPTAAPTTSRPPTTAPPVPAPEPAASSASIGSIDGGPSGMYFPIIRGTAEPGDTITVTIGNTNYTVTADARGSWMVSGPFTGLSSGTQTVTAYGKSNTTPYTSTFELAPPPTMSVASTPSGINLSLQGIPNSNVQVMIDGTKTVPLKLDGGGNYFGPLSLLPGDHTIIAKYQSGNRQGLSFGPVKVRVS
ncbi:MAG: zf-HC2 domain-containing protein [Propionibacteriaceae bacterium]|nr:zf-HC2 domain-containing protein [Propionibacteriaceae bacterium]